jgi:hypothetical protein
MADFLCNYNIPWVVTFIKTSIAFSKYFKDKRQRKNFINFLKSVSLTGSSLLIDVGRVVPEIKHFSRSLSHFFNQSEWQEQYFENKRKELVLHYLFENIVAVALDFTALAKKGKHFENEGVVYDARIDKVTDGFPLLIATAINSQGHYSPLSFKRYTKKDLERFGENQIKECFIKELINSFNKEPVMPVFIGDAGFLRKNIVKMFLQERIPFVLRTVPRKVILNSGKKCLTSQLQSGTYANVVIATQGWGGIHCNLLIAPYDDKDKENHQAFLTNLSFAQYSKTALLRLYQKRWAVEETIKELKQYFGLENFRVRSWQGSERLLALLFLAVTLTHLSLRKHNAWIQYVLPQLIEGLSNNICFSIYHCRKMFLKLLFCAQIPDLVNDRLTKQCHSP